MELRAETIIDAPADTAWAVLGTRFAEIDEWATPISASSMDGEASVGAVRTCQFAGFGPFKPGIVKASAAKRRFASVGRAAPLCRTRAPTRPQTAIDHQWLAKRVQ